MSDIALALMIIDQETENEVVENKRKRKHRYWVKEWLSKRERFSHENLLKELHETSSSDYKNFLRMDYSTFNEILNKITPLIQKQDTKMRNAITASERLSATLRFLATGQSFEDLKFLTAISPQALGRIIIETCEALIKVLKDNIKLPKDQNEWKYLAKEFGTKWNFPNCIGAIDGKHVEIKKPAHSGSYYFNYKKTFSVVLLAIVDANYDFIMVDVGANGRVSDGGVFTNSTFYERFEEGALNIPDHERLPNTNEKLPFIFVGDDAFPLMENLMKPYSMTVLNAAQQVFNYRLSRSRRIVENAFGILSSRFRILLSTINLHPKKATTIVLACCYVHNFLRKRNENVYLHQGFDVEDVKTGNFIKGNWRLESKQLLDLKVTTTHNSSRSAKIIRDKFYDYFNTVGSVPWQLNKTETSVK